MSTRQQERYAKQQAAKRARRELPPRKAERLRRGAFKAARAKFAEVAAIIKETAGDEAARIARLRLVGPLRHRGKGRGAIAPRYGNDSSHLPHQSMQERLRRVVGGWALRKRVSGFTKRTLLQAVAQRPIVAPPQVIAQQLRDEVFA